MKVAVVGATGLVGRKMLDVLTERDFPVENMFPVASASSVGSNVEFKGKQHRVVDVKTAVSLKPDLAIFSAGGSVSEEWAPRFAEVGTTVVDNSSAWRMDPNVKLVVPEINASELSKEDKIIANPNCSTIQLVMALKPLYDQFGIERIVVSTYQSVSGTGIKAVSQLEKERRGEVAEMAYDYQIDKNCIPHCDVFMDNGYTKEEMKLVNETRKILGDPSIMITATAVRVPVIGGHSESVNVRLKKDFELKDIARIITQMPGVVVQDNVDKHLYPMPLFAHEKNDVFVGRLRRDESEPNALNMWIVSDNLRKGAATNAVQICEYLVTNELV